MKKFMLPFLLLVIFLTSCNFFGPSPKDVLTKYLNSYYKGNYKESYALLSAKDKNFKIKENMRQTSMTIRSPKSLPTKFLLTSRK